VSSENNNTNEEKKTQNIDGKSTPTEETVERTERIQAADPDKQTTSEPSDSPASELGGPSDEEKEAKAKAAAERRAARAREKAAKQGGEADGEEKPKEPSPNQPKLDHAVQLIKEHVSDDAVEEAYINEFSNHMPCLVIKKSRLYDTAAFFKNHEELQQTYLRNLTGADVETHMEVIYHLINLETKNEYCIKVKTERDHASVPSVTPIWETANWPEREVYDLLGIDFPGHPDLRRIMMTDDWVGHPLRKDYEAIDPEV
jgi:NADH-quinone oxidoreductase subunit C